MVIKRFTLTDITSSLAATQLEESASKSKPINAIDFRRAYDDATPSQSRVNPAVAWRVLRELGVAVYRARRTSRKTPISKPTKSTKVDKKAQGIEKLKT